MYWYFDEIYLVTFLNSIVTLSKMQIKRIREDILNNPDHGLDLSLKPKDIVKLPVRERQEYFSLSRSLEESWTGSYANKFKDHDPKPVPDKVRVITHYYLGSHSIGQSDLYVFPVEKTMRFKDFHPFNIYGEKRLGGKKIGSLARLSTLVMLVEDSLAELEYTMEHPFMSNELEDMLAHIGITEAMPLKQYLETMIGYANSRGFEFKMPTQTQQPYHGRQLLFSQGSLY